MTTEQWESSDRSEYHPTFQPLKIYKNIFLYYNFQKKLGIILTRIFISQTFLKSLKLFFYKIGAHRTNG